MIMRNCFALAVVLFTTASFAQDSTLNQPVGSPKIESAGAATSNPETITNSNLESAEAKPALGTKADIVAPSQPLSTNEPVVGGMQFVQMIVALGLVFALLKFGLPKLVGKMGKRLSTPLNSSIQVEESANFGAGSLQVITARGKTLLIAVTQSGVSCLADLTDDSTKSAQEPAFFELFDSAKQESTIPTKAVIESELPQQESAKPNPKIRAYTSPQPSQSDDEAKSQDLQERLRRLSRLVN